MSFKLLLLQLGCTFSTAADKLRFILSDSQCLRAFNRGFPLFFFFFLGCFYFRMRGNLLTYIKHIMTTYVLRTNDRCERSFV